MKITNFQKLTLMVRDDSKEIMLDSDETVFFDPKGTVFIVTDEILKAGEEKSSVRIARNRVVDTSER